MGSMKVVKPKKCLENGGAFLRKMGWGWHQRKITHFAGEHIIGPFDFSTIDGEPGRIGDGIWHLFLSKADSSKVDL